MARQYDSQGAGKGDREMGASSTQNTEGKRIYSDDDDSPGSKYGEKRQSRRPGSNTEVWDGRVWVPQNDGVPVNKPPATKVENTAKPPAPADLEDKPEDSPLIRASKKRQRAQREAMKTQK